jgi:hypothetical protein
VQEIIMKNILAVALASLTLSACVGEVPLADKSCPCATGQFCCEATNRCVVSPDMCNAGSTVDANSKEVQATPVAMDAADTGSATPDASGIYAVEDAQTMDAGEHTRWQKIPETPLPDVGQVSSMTVAMGDRVTVFFAGESRGRIWSYRFAQNDWVSVSSGLPWVTGEAGTVWMGTRLLFWSGLGLGAPANQGGVYDPVTDAWSSISVDGSLALVVRGSAYTGREAFMYGSTTGVWLDPSSGVFYNPSTDRWRASPAGTPDTEGPAVVGLGSKIVVWGGAKPDRTATTTIVVGDGAVYDAVTNTWTPMATRTAPGPRAGMIAFAARGQALVWGGTDHTWDSLGNLTLFRDGAMYEPTRDVWTPISTVNSAARAENGLWAEEQGLAYLWAGQESPGVKLWTYSPANDTWASIDVADLPPLSQLSFHWTGSRLLVLGLVDAGSAEDAAGTNVLTGYLFNP